MAKFNPRELLSTYGSIAALNSNFDDIADLFEQCVFRDGTAPNSMSTDLDMNHFRLKNVGAGVDPSDVARLSDIQDYIDGSITPPLIFYTPPGTGGVERTLQSIIESKISLADYGYVADGVTDDTAAWQAAIVAADALGVGIIEVPWGETGVSLVTGQIVNGALPKGLSFIGTGKHSGNDYNTEGVRLLYTGTGICWNINANLGGLGSTGRWLWKNITFQAEDGAATMFDFNDTLTHDPVEGGPYHYMEHIRFEACYFHGGHAEATQTGDAIRATKCFQLVLDENTYIRGWRRGVWLKGSDNCTIRARIYINARNVMIEGVGTFGNDNVVETRYFGGVFGSASEATYMVWDNANSTTYVSNYFEEVNTGAIAVDAMLYLDGNQTRLASPHFAAVSTETVPLFRLGPNATNIYMDHPKLTIPSTLWAPVFDAAEDNKFGDTQSSYIITVVGANTNFQATCGVHPRMRYVAPMRGKNGVVDQARQMTTDGAGYRPKQFVLSALNYWDSPEGSAANSGATSFVPDANASGGYAVVYDNAVAQSGFRISLVVGKHVMVGDKLRVRVRAKTTAGASWPLTYARNTDAGTAISLAGLGASYSIVEANIDLAGWAVGDELNLLCYNGTAADDLTLDYLSIEQADVVRGLLKIDSSDFVGLQINSTSVSGPPAFYTSYNGSARCYFGQGGWSFGGTLDETGVITAGAWDLVLGYNNAGTVRVTSTGFDLFSGKDIRIGGTKVVGAQQAAIADATDAATAITQLNALLAAARTHGLIAT